VGYREYTLFAPIALQLPALEYSLDAPFWSLHLELYGSLLILLLVRLRSWSVWPHRTAVVVCAVVFGTHPMFLFVIGHLCSDLVRRSPVRFMGTGLFALGLIMSATKDWAAVEVVRAEIARFAPAAAPNAFQFQSQLAAIALFAGAVLSPIVQKMLGWKVCGYLGRMSFSIYLLHFPILFTLGCAEFMALTGGLPYAPRVAITFFSFVVVVVIAASGFERWVDRPAISLSRRLEKPRS
jgi:peptidoglycan/LPS O-acetylase OafA/YrhL